MNNIISHPWLALDIDETLARTDHDRFQEMKELFWDPWFSYEDHHIHVERLNYIWTHDEANKFMKDKIHDDEYQKTISMVPWSLEKVTKLHKKRLFNCYITARPDTVISWTKEWLKNNWFPNLPIIAKPINIQKDKEHLWKAETLYNMYKQWVLGIVDDQIKLIEQMDNYFPDYKGNIHILTKRPFNLETNISYTLSNHWNELFKILNK